MNSETKKVLNEIIDRIKKEVLGSVSDYNASFFAVDFAHAKVNQTIDIINEYLED